jgi:predicted ATP-binding protein involved in virulence
MILTNIGLVNWHLYPLTDVKLGGKVIGLVGRNGVGKSTVLDAIQVVFTGGSESVQLNKRASVDKASAKRSINDYCLGRIDEKQTIREQCATYILLAFEDPQNIKPPVTIMLAFEASRSESRPTLTSRLIVKGAVLNAEDIAIVEGDQMTVESWYDCKDRIFDLIKQRGGTYQECRDSAKEFIREYMHVLMFKNRSSNWKQFQKNFLNCIGFDRMGTVNDFVQKHVLGEDEIDIFKLRQSYTLYRELLDVVKTVRENLARLGLLDGKLQAYKAANEKREVEQMIAALTRAINARRENRAIRNNIKSLETRVMSANTRVTDAKLTLKGLDHELIQTREKRTLLSQASQKSGLEQKLANLTTQREQLLRPLLGDIGIGRKISALAKVFPRDEELTETSNIVVALSESVSGKGFPQIEELPVYPEEVDDLMDQLRPVLHPAQVHLKANLEQMIGKQQKLKDELKTVSDQLKALDSSQVQRSPATLRLLRALDTMNVKSQILCDIADINDEAWRDAAESFLGKRRETIFVAPTDWPFVYGLLVKNRREYAGASVANTGTLDVQTITEPEPGTLNAVFETSDLYARAFLNRFAGSVKLTDKREDFDKGGRWLSKEGTYYDGLSVSTRYEAEHRFGRAALQRNRQTFEERKLDIEDALTEMQPLKEVTEAASKILSAVVDSFEQLDRDGASFAHAASKGAEIQAEMREVNQQLEAIEQVDTSIYDDEIDSLGEEIKLINAKIETDQSEATRAKYQLEDAMKKRDGDVRTSGSTYQVDNTRQEYKRIAANTSASAHIKAFVELGKRAYNSGKALDSIAAEAAAARQRAENEANNLRSECTIQTKQCLESLEATSQVPDDFDLTMHIMPWVEATTLLLRDATLLGHEENLRVAETESMGIFQTSYIQDLAGRFMKLDQEIGAINNLLKTTPFLGEIYQIKKIAAPGYEAFHKVIKESRTVDDISGGGLLSWNATNRDEVNDAMETVKKTIFNEDPSTNLDDYTDYRRYWVFDIEITNTATGAKNTFMSRKGTGSGGEQQTPYYIALMTALSNVYYGGPFSHLKKDEGGLCLAIFDEAFNNMDERVASQIVSFGRELGLQLIACGPLDKKATMQRNCDTLLTVVKSTNGRQTSVTPEYLTDLTRREMADIDPSRKSDEDLQQMMESGNAA